MKVSLVLLAGGNSERFNENKLLYSINGSTLLERALGVVDFYPFYEVILVCRGQDLEEFTKIVRHVGASCIIVEGGETRGESAYNGVKSASGDYVLIHDCARAFVEKPIVDRIISQLKGVVGVVPVIAETDSIVRSDGKYLDRSAVKRVQTPQGFSRVELLRLFETHGFNYTDEGSLWATENNVILVDGDSNNIKVTYKEDVCSHIKGMRIGNGYDFHPLVEDRELILGGVALPFHKGLLGHSDGDAPLHALCDALLNALALGDIGKFFPDTDMRYKGISSMVLLREVKSMLDERDVHVFNVSMTILAEKPKLAGYIDRMKKNVADILDIPLSMIGIGATTTEGMGLIGREEGIACYASVVLTEDF